MDGLEGEVVDFHLSCIDCGISIFNIFLAFKDYTGERAWEIWALGLTSGGKGNETVGQPWWWETCWWTIYFQPSLVGTSGCIDTCGGIGMLGKFLGGWYGSLAGQRCNLPWPTKLKNPTWNKWFKSCRSTSKWIENRGLLWPHC